MGSHVFYGCTNLTVYAETASIPERWSVRWNSSYRPVVWGCTLSEDKTYVVSFTKTTESLSNYNAKIRITAPYRENYTFGGWSKTATGTQADYTVDNVSEAPNDIVLYAIWLAE